MSAAKVDDQNYFNSLFENYFRKCHEMAGY